MTYAHPGSIQVSVGQAEEGIRRNIEQGDALGVAKFVRYLVGTVSVYKEDEPEIWKELEKIPKPFTQEDESAGFEDDMKRRELCLRILRKKNIFGYLGDPPMGNADALKDALEDEVEA